MIAWWVAAVLALGATELGPEVIEAVGAPAGAPLEGAVLERHLTALSSEIRCPVCQGQAIVDSPAESARHMKEQVRAMLAAGFSDEQILSWLEGRYGEFIRLSPRPEGLNLIVWLLPMIVLGLGAVVVGWVVGRSRKAALAAGAATGAAAGPAVGTGKDDEMAAYLERVRREAGGRDG